jgi:hypothetical protein
MPIATVQLPNGKIAELEVPQGATPEQIESFVMSSPELGGQQVQAPEQQEMQPQTQPTQQPQQENGVLANVAMGVPQGLGNAAIGAFQAATDVGEKAASLIERLYFGDNLNMDTIGDRLANQVKQRNELQAQLPTSQRVGVAVGEALPFLTTGVGTGAKVAQVAGKVAGITAGGAVGGAVSSALSPQEQAGLENRAMQTVKGGAVGGAVGAGFGVAGKVASGAVTLGRDILAGFKARPTEAIAGFTSKPVETLDSISAAIKDGSSNAYKAVRESGAIFKPEAIKSIFAGIDNSLKESGILNPRLHGDTIGILNDLKTLAKEKGDAIGLEELDQYRQLLGDVVKKNTDISGKINADALKANIAIDKLDEIVDGLGGNALSKGDKGTLDLLNTARTEWKRYRKFDAISSIVKRADGDPNRTKTLLQNFVNNPKNLRGFSNAEVEALKRAKTNSTSEGLMKAIGKFGFDIGSGRNAGNSALPIGSILIGGGTGGLTAIVGTVARQAQKLSARGQIDDVLKLIQGQEPKIASKVIQQLSPKTRDFVLTNILTQSINKSTQ